MASRQRIGGYTCFLIFEGVYFGQTGSFTHLGDFEMSLIMSMEQMIDAQLKSVQGKTNDIARFEETLAGMKAELVVMERDLALSRSALAYAKHEGRAARQTS